jgi:hypothetical protein
LALSLDVLDTPSGAPTSNCTSQVITFITDNSHVNRTQPFNALLVIMYPADNQRKRPPPIKVPLTYIPPRYLNASPTKNGGQPQQDQQQQHQQQEQPQKQTVSRNASSSIQQGPRSAKSELTFSSAFSSEHGDSCPPNSGSQRSRASALATLSSMMEQARASPRKSETGKSEADSTRVKSTTRSKHSVRSQHSAKSSQAQVETNDNDERTSRAKIEARSEQNLFKMTGQVPPTPMIGN